MNERVMGIITIIVIGFMTLCFTVLIDKGMEDDGMGQGKLSDDSDMRIYVPHRRGSGRSDNGHDKRMGDKE